MRYSNSEYPNIFSFITLRKENFGAILFNPYLGIEQDLSFAGAYTALLCNGRNSCSQIITQLQKQFSLSRDQAVKEFESNLSVIDNMCALELFDSVNDQSVAVEVDQFPSQSCLTAAKSVIWDVTYSCNLSCPHCLTNSGEKSLQELNTKQAVSLIDQLACQKVLYLSLSGGEPFLRKDICQLLKHISQTGMRMDVATNGLVLPEKILNCLKKLSVFQVQVSIDGIGASHDSFRGLKGAFTASCETLRKLKQEGIDISISTTATSQNLNELERIIDLAVNLGCCGFKAIPFLAAGRGKHYQKQLQLSKQQSLQFCQLIVRKSKELMGVINIATETSFSFLLDGQDYTTADLDGGMVCSAGYDTLSIGADGTVYPCPFLQEFPLGNLRHESLRNIWLNSKVLRTLRTLKKKDMCAECKSCSYASSLCSGGCRAAAYISSGSIRGKDPLCFK